MVIYSKSIVRAQKSISCRLTVDDSYANLTRTLRYSNNHTNCLNSKIYLNSETNVSRFSNLNDSALAIFQVTNSSRAYSDTVFAGDEHLRHIPT